MMTRNLFSHWQEALVEVVSTLENVILVTHSTGGMYALSTPTLDKMLTGLVLMDSATSANWQDSAIDVRSLSKISNIA